MENLAQKIKTDRGIKSFDLGNGEHLYFWYANNKGRGHSNVTIIRSTAPRASMSRNQTEVIAEAITSGWGGIVNFNRKVQAVLGL